MGALTRNIQTDFKESREINFSYTISVIIPHDTILAIALFFMPCVRTMRTALP